jgi:beta-1,4-mannosyl-glycoprotein beta-1,4-N-acetylglucosaminyltransferase
VIFDCFMFNDELDILECRLEELAPVVDRFVLVECGESHLGSAKPSHFSANRSRFDRWAPQIEHVWVDRLRATEPKEREHEHRECIRMGLEQSRATARDIVLQSDADEIPRRACIPTLVEMLASRESPHLVALEPEHHFFAVDWRYPGRCEMTPAASYFEAVGSFWDMRLASIAAPRIPDAAWHFSWLGRRAANVRKIETFYHGHEIAHMRPMLESETYWREGVHVDGVKMIPVDVDDTYPAFIRERRCPASWFRPR